MTKYEIDPEALEGLAASLAAAADSAPADRVPEVDDCGSSTVADAYSESGAALGSALRRAAEEAMSLATSATKAASAYRETDESATRAAEGARG